ncbi:MAG: DUF368 domain-containing protein, partial [Planctomycetes bacterium]|nr:DUF368 domain-containing protein [Planctomycetota bacterium]
AAEADAAASAPVPTPEDPAPPAGSGPSRAMPAGRILFLFAAGAAAISAMVLPGVSGSFVLLLLGAYRDILRALDCLDLLVLGVFGLGCLVGLLLFVRLLRCLLERWYSSTVAFLGGLILGSLWSLWPFKRIPELGGEPLTAGELWPYLENTWPAAGGAEVALQAAAALAGAAIVAGFFLYERGRASAGRSRAQDIAPSGS